MFYPSKPGGFFYEMSDNPKSDGNVDWPSEMTFSGNIATMHPNGPTDFGIGKNISSFSDSIGGCNMDFAATAKRGYAYKADDARDIEYKCLMKADGISSGNGFSISFCTGHHSGSDCCQGFAYMCTTEITDNPSNFRFRKETVHVEYTDSPEGTFTSPKCNFRINGLGRYVGLSACRYNRPSSGGTSPQDDEVVLELWFNPNPDNNITDWTMVKRIVDKAGNGWTGSPGKCNGDDDQVGPWSNAQNRMKTNSTSGTIAFKSVTLREIDPFGSFETNPPPSGGGAVSRDLVYAAIGLSGQQTDPNNYYLGMIVVSHEIVEALTDPDPLEVLGPGSWYDPATGDEIADFCFSKDHQFGTGADSYWASGYWSNSDNNCVLPGVDVTDLGSSTRIKNPTGGPVLVNAKIYMIFWGTDWQTRTAAPTGAGVIDRIQNRLLGTDKAYFAKLSQYGGITTPTWGNSCYNTAFPVPTGSNITETQAKDCIIDTFNRGLLPVPQSPNEDLYIVMIPVGKTLVSDNLSTANGLHSKFRASITPPVTIPPPPTGCPTGFHLANGVCVPDTVTPPPPTSTTSRVHGFFRLLWNINTAVGSGACTGTGGGGGGPSGNLSIIYDVSADEEKELSNTSAYDFRTRLAEKINTSDSVLRGEVVKQLDVPLKKFGLPNVTHTIFARIWSSGGGVMYTSPTTFTPDILTTSFVSKTFDFSTNTYALQLGDKIGVEYVTSAGSNYVLGGYGDNNTNRSIMAQWENDDHWDEKESRDFACTMWS